MLALSFQSTFGHAKVSRGIQLARGWFGRGHHEAAQDTLSNLAPQSDFSASAMLREVLLVIFEFEGGFGFHLPAEAQRKAGGAAGVVAEDAAVLLHVDGAEGDAAWRLLDWLVDGVLNFEYRCARSSLQTFETVLRRIQPSCLQVPSSPPTFAFTSVESIGLSHRSSTTSRSHTRILRPTVRYTRFQTS